MALTALTLTDTIEFVSINDPSRKVTKVPKDPDDESKGFDEVVTIEEGASKFRLRPLDVYLMGHIYDNAQHLVGQQGSTEVGIKTRMHQTNIDAVKFGLAGIAHFADKQGRPIHHEVEDCVVNGRKYPAVKTHVLDTLGLRLIEELASKIKEISEVSADEEKKLKGASLPSV